MKRAEQTGLRWGSAWLVLAVLVCFVGWPRVLRGPLPARVQGQPPAPPTPGEQATAHGVVGPIGPLLQMQLGSRTQGARVRVPIKTVEDPHAPSEQSAEKLVVVAGIANVQQARDGSPVLEQSRVGTSVLSSIHARAIAKESHISTEAKTRLPWLVVDSQDKNQENLVRSARPFLKLARAVQWDRVRQLHIAEFLVGLDAESGEAGALSEPLEASLAVSCDEVTPQTIKFSTIGPAGDQLVRVACSAQVKNERAEQVLSVRLQSGSLDYAFQLPHRAGPYQLSASSSSVLGLGLGELTFTAVSAEEDGTPLPAASELRIPLRVSDGELDPDSLTIAAGASQGSASVHVRGSGQLQVRAGISERESKPVALRVRWPILLSCMAPIGGAIGGYLAVALQRKRQAKQQRRRGQRVTACIEGALVGVVVVLALTLVPSFGFLPGWARTAEVAWFVVAVFAGFLGLELLERLARLFFKQSDGDGMKPATASERE